MACFEEGDAVHGVEGNAACVVVGEQEDAGVGSDQDVHQADLQQGVGGFLEDLLGENLRAQLEEPLPGYLLVIQSTVVILMQQITQFK